MTRNNKSVKFIIGVTGITGSGTSTVAAVLAEYGGLVISADKLAHDAVKKNEPAFAEIVNAFGSGILGEDGEIDRRALSRRVFGNKAELAKLEAIVHPKVIAKIRESIDRAEGYAFAVIDAPLLIESGIYKDCDSCLLVTARDDIRTRRVIARDGIDEETAARRIKSRAGDEALRPFVDVVIENNGDMPALRERVSDALKKQRPEVRD